jgi:hypothetical protein
MKIKNLEKHFELLWKNVKVRTINNPLYEIHFIKWRKDVKELYNNDSAES